MVRRIFSSSPRDPRYHMLSHISAKFAQPAKESQHEPRAALFLNRFTRTLTIMYATAGLSDIIGIPAEVMRGRSFYYCIAENCLQDAVKCLENAKGNDSIAYLRFWFRDPRVDDNVAPDDDSDEEMAETEMSEDTDGGGVDLHTGRTSPDSAGSFAIRSSGSMDVDDPAPSNSRTSSGDSSNGADTHEAIFGTARGAQSSTSSLMPSPDRDLAFPVPPLIDPVELEAVISCTSDGLVVCLRKARPMIPHPTQRPGRPVYENGLFAAPWAAEPMLPPIDVRPGAGFGSSFAPALGPQGARRTASPAVKAHPPVQHDFMAAIREQAIFAWALTGINGALGEFAQGKPLGESMPQDGLPVWASDPRQNTQEGGRTGNNGWPGAPESFGSATRSPENGRVGGHLFGDPGLNRDGSSGVRSAHSSNGHSGSATPYSPR